MTFGRLFAAEEDEEYFDGEEEEVEENAAPERTVMGKGQSTAEPTSPAPSSTHGGALRAWTLLGHPILSLGSFPVATATGETPPGTGCPATDLGWEGHTAGTGSLASRRLLQHRTLFYTGAKQDNSARFIIPLFCI